jgi:hypothetical protein
MPDLDKINSLKGNQNTIPPGEQEISLVLMRVGGSSLISGTAPEISSHQETVSAWIRQKDQNKIQNEPYTPSGRFFPKLKSIFSRTLFSRAKNENKQTLNQAISYPEPSETDGRIILKWPEQLLEPNLYPTGSAKHKSFDKLHNLFYAHIVKESNDENYEAAVLVKDFLLKFQTDKQPNALEAEDLLNTLTIGPLGRMNTFINLSHREKADLEIAIILADPERIKLAIVDIQKTINRNLNESFTRFQKTKEYSENTKSI